MESVKSIWKQYSLNTDYPGLKKNIKPDVAVIGGGITGISTGLLLAQKGVNVMVLESNKVGYGSSADSTGNLYYTIDNLLSSLTSTYDADVIKKVADSRTDVLSQIKTWVHQYHLKCDYQNVPWYLYSNSDDGSEKIEKEFKTGMDAGIAYTKPQESEIPYPHKNAIKLPHQHQINPLRYVQELSRAAMETGCRIYEHTPVISVQKKGDRFLIQADQVQVDAEYVVHATHSPKGIKMVQTLLGPYREYGIACPIKDPEMPAGIFWGYHEEAKKISTRIYSEDDKNYLIAVGEPHKTGQASDNKMHIQNLENFVYKHFDVQQTEFRWGGQHYRPADLLPYIGPENKNSKEFIATGFSTDGLVYGTLAGMIIADRITGKINKWENLYSSARHQPLRAAPKFIQENVNVAKQYVNDFARSYEDSEAFALDSISPGEGRVIKFNGQKMAVYRNMENRFEAVSAICTHMKCVVHWNGAERSWDCPCHGSRFRPDGAVIEGPAFTSLKKMDVSKVKQEE